MTPERRYMGIEMLDEWIVHQSGAFCSIKRWLKGAHPQYGTIVWGLTGWETLVELDVIRPHHIVQVQP